MRKKVFDNFSEEFKEWKNKWEYRLERQDFTIETVYKTMKENNPIIIPRNHQVEKVLKAAVENRDYTKFYSLLKALSTPYNYDEKDEKYMQPPEASDLPYVTYCGT